MSTIDLTATSKDLEQRIRRLAEMIDNELHKLPDHKVGNIEAWMDEISVLNRLMPRDEAGFQAPIIVKVKR